MATLREIAAAAGIPESTARLYRDEFEEFLETTGQGKRRRYSDTAVETMRRIVAWKREGWSAASIRDELARERMPAPRARRRTTEERLDEITAVLRAQAGEVAMLRAEVGALRAEIKRLADRQTDAPLSLERILTGG